MTRERRSSHDSAVDNVAERLSVFTELLPMRPLRQQAEDLVNAVLAICHAPELERRRGGIVYATGLGGKVCGQIQPSAEATR